MSPVKALRSSWAATVALVMVMWAQLPHSAHVFQHIIAEGQDGWPFALGFEAAVLMFVVRNMHSASWFFAALSVLINVKYYEMHNAPMWGGALHDIWGQWLLSLALPFVIAMYSHVLAHVQGEEVWALRWPAMVRNQLQAKVAEWRQGKEEAQPEPLQIASPLQEDEASPPDVQEDEAEAQEEAQLDPKERAMQLFSEGLTKAQIAKELQKDPSTIGRWLNGHGKV